MRGHHRVVDDGPFPSHWPLLIFVLARFGQVNSAA
jgi:hypothetical protein